MINLGGGVSPCTACQSPVGLALPPPTTRAWAELYPFHELNKLHVFHLSLCGHTVDCKH